MVDQQLSYNSYYGLMGDCGIMQCCDWHTAYTGLKLWSLMLAAGLYYSCQFCFEQISFRLILH